MLDSTDAPGIAFTLKSWGYSVESGPKALKHSVGFVSAAVRDEAGRSGEKANIGMMSRRFLRTREHAALPVGEAQRILDVNEG